MNQTQEQIRLDLANRIIEARSKVSRFDYLKRSDENILTEIQAYPDFQELDSLQEKAAAIILGYVPVCLECGERVKMGGGSHKTVIGAWREFCCWILWISKFTKRYFGSCR